MSHVKGKVEGLGVTGLGRMEQCLSQASGGRVHTCAFPFLLTHTHTPALGWSRSHTLRQVTRGVLPAQWLKCWALLVQCCREPCALCRVPCCPPCSCDTWSPLRHLVGEGGIPRSGMGWLDAGRWTDDIKVSSLVTTCTARGGDLLTTWGRAGLTRAECTAGDRGCPLIVTNGRWWPCPMGGCDSLSE